MGQVACTAHWYDRNGEERTRPSLQAYQGQSSWVETYLNQIFVLRLHPRQQVALAGFQITGRPFEPAGQLIIMVLPNASNSAALGETRRILADPPKDSRTAPQGGQGGRPTPPPPSAKHFR